MKKILLTLFAFAAVFVACEKDTYENEFETIVPEVEGVSESYSMSNEDAFNFLNDLVSGIDVDGLEPADASSSRNSANKIDVAFFNDGTSIEKAHLASEQFTGDRCYGNYTLIGDFEYSLSTDGTRLFVYNPSSPSTSANAVNGADAFRLSTGLQTRYAQVFGANLDNINNIRRDSRGNPTAILGAQPARSGFDFTVGCTTATVYEYGTRIIGGAHDGRVIIPLDPLDMDAASNPSAAAVGTGNLQLQLVRRVAGSGINTWENVGDPFTNPNYVAPTTTAWTAGTGADSNLFSHATYGSYRVTAAPFPLTGFLATVVSDSTSPANTNNYAGTSEQAVRDAIEANFAE